MVPCSYRENKPMLKKLFLTAAVLACASTSAFAWTDRFGHWHEVPQLYGPINPGAAVYAPYGAQPAYVYGPPPPVVYGYGAPVIVAPPPTDAQVIAGTILGIAAWPLTRGGTGEKAAVRRCRGAVAAARGRRRGRFLHRVLRLLQRISLVPDAVSVMKTTQQQAHQQNEHLL